MDAATYEALMNVKRAIDSDRRDLREAFEVLAKRLNAQDEAIIAMSGRVEELTKTCAELIIINGAKDADK